MDLFVLVSLWLIFLVLLFYAHTHTLRLLILFAFGALLFFPLAFVSWVVWGLKDWIAPHAGYSEGWDAWVRFFEQIWQFALLVIVFVIAGYFANRKARKRIEANRELREPLLER
jgi:hypothetical protein